MPVNDIDPTQDPASVYYLHPSDHVGIKLISTPFDGTGYADWKSSMIIGLTAKNKLSFVDDTTSKPPPNSSDSKCWKRCNNMVIGWIIASLDRVVAKSIMYYNNAQEIWYDLEERFGKSSSAQLHSLQEELTKLTEGASMSIADYFTRVKSIWDEIDHLDPIPIRSCNGCCCGLIKHFLKSQQDQRLIH